MVWGCASRPALGILVVGAVLSVLGSAQAQDYPSRPVTIVVPYPPGGSVDGVARMPDGTLRYFALGDTTSGAMAEQTVIDLRQSFVLPDGTDPVLVAAAMNPALSSWVALQRRIDFQAGQTVLILGATGSSGQMAVQVAKRLGDLPLGLRQFLLTASAELDEQRGGLRIELFPIARRAGKGLAGRGQSRGHHELDCFGAHRHQLRNQRDCCID